MKKEATHRVCCVHQTSMLASFSMRNSEVNRARERQRIASEFSFGYLLRNLENDRK